MRIRNFLHIIILAALSSSTTSIAQDRSSAKPEMAAGGLEISQPSDGSRFQSGDSVVVSAESVPPFHAQSVALLSEFGVMEDASAPFEFVLEIPADFVGRSSISAMGKDGSGGFAEASAVEIVVEASAELTGISMYPRNIYLNGRNDERQIRVSGQYSDGNERDLSASTNDVAFASSDPSILSISDSGRLLPKNNGTATISAQVGGFEDTMTVEVLNIDE